MFRHIVVMKWRRPLTAAELTAVNDALGSLCRSARSVRAFSFGPDLGLRTGNADYALVVDFDDEAGWHEYTVHPAHDHPRRVLGEFVAQQLGAQVEVRPGSEGPDASGAATHPSGLPDHGQHSM